ncbi:MAG TPA: diguanylate cyclase [Gammaproteobacteria bacterium]|nr:diguanylate cyclase [Gammaproteobacteria bacterium]
MSSFRCALILALYFGAQSTLAAEPFPPGSSLRFRHIGLESGLAQSSVQAIAQDAQGYMWLGTQDGLQRYDGYDFHTYRHDPGNPTSLADNSINALAVGADGTLWVGTTDLGVDRLDVGSSRFLHLQHKDGDGKSLSDNTVFTLLVDRERRLWVGTGQGLDMLQADGTFKHYVVPAKLPNGKHVYSLFEAAGGRLWVGTAHGLYYLDRAQDRVLPYFPAGTAPTGDLKGVFTESPIHSFADADDGGLWLGSGRGLVELDKQGAVRHFFQHKGDVADSLPNEHVLTMLVDPDGSLWLGTYGGGVDRYDPATGRFEAHQHDATDPGSLSDDNIDILYRDSNGLIWIGTDNAGVDIYNPETRLFGYYRHRQGDPNSLASSVVWDIYKDAHDYVWVATDAGLTRLDPTRRHYAQYELGDRPVNRRDDNLVSAVRGDRDGNIWAGADYGLYRYQPASDSFKRYELVASGQNPNGDVVTEVFPDIHDRLWLATGDGLVRFDPASGGVQRYVHDPARADSLPDDNVQVVCETLDGRIWVGTSNGLASFDGVHDSFRVYREDLGDVQSLSYNNVQACHTDATGDLWVGTASGLNHLDVKTGKFKRYFVSDGLPNNNIYAVLPGSNGGIWISSGDGLSHLDAVSGSFRNYSTSNGLQSSEFNSGAAFASVDGELFFGGINGMNAFRPDQLVRNTRAPRVAITRFTRLGVEVPLRGPAGPVTQVDVLYRQNILTFEFTAFDYQAPESNSFSYKLDGFDQDWHNMQGRRQITYTNLDPGRYVLQVRGANSDGVWSDGETTLSIRVLPPAWRTWWAWLLYGAGTFVAGMLGLKIYTRTLRREHDLVNEQQRRRWSEALHNLIQSVSVLRDERAIAEQLIDGLTNFINYEQALFYAEHDGQLKLTASRGISAGEQDYLEQWPVQHPRVIARLRLSKKPLMLTPEDAATLAGGQARGGTRHFFVVPVLSGGGAFRLLLVGRPVKAMDPQQMEIAAAMAKQVSVALDNAQLIKDLENLATTDGLTRLANRRHFMERAESEFERSQRYKRDLSVFLLDADHFKTINDTHGHETGDRVLRLLAAACRESMRHLDVIGRYGGEELVVLLPETSAALAFEAAERLRKRIEELRIPVQDGDIRVAVSIGVATADAATESVASLINQADRALYEAKRGGRNRVSAAGKERS